MAACLENIVESDDVAADVGVRVRYAVAHARLRGEVDYDGRLPAGEKGLDHSLVRYVSPDKMPTDCLWLKRFQFTQSVFLDRDIIVVVEIVHPHYDPAPHDAEKPADKVGAYEPGSAGYKDGFPVKTDLLHVFSRSCSM